MTCGPAWKGRIVSESFWAGLLVIPAIAIVGAVVIVLLALARKAWASIDSAVIARTDLAPNRVNPMRRGPDGRPKYLRSANVVRDALLKSPRLYSARGFGWMVVLVKNGKTGA